MIVFFLASETQTHTNVRGKEPHMPNDTPSPEGLYRATHEPIEKPPPLAVYDLSSQGRLKDARLRRKIKSEQYSLEVYQDYLDRHTAVQEKYAEFLEVVHKSQKKEQEMQLDQARAQHQSAKLAAEAKALEYEAAKHQREIDKMKEEAQRSEQLHQLQMKQMEADIRRTEVETDNLKRPQETSKKSIPFEPILTKARDLDDLTRKTQAAIALFGEEHREDIEALADQQRRRIIKGEYR